MAATTWGADEEEQKDEGFSQENMGRKFNKVWIMNRDEEIERERERVCLKINLWRETKQDWLFLILETLFGGRKKQEKRLREREQRL